jgi:hypothetical protein
MMIALHVIAMESTCPWSRVLQVLDQRQLFGECMEHSEYVFNKLPEAAFGKIHGAYLL